MIELPYCLDRKSHNRAMTWRAEPPKGQGCCSIEVGKGSHMGHRECPKNQIRNKHFIFIYILFLIELTDYLYGDNKIEICAKKLKNI